MRWALLDVWFFLLFVAQGFRVFNACPRNTGGPRAIPGGEGTGGPGDTLAGEPTAEGPDRRAFPAKSRYGHFLKVPSGSVSRVWAPRSPAQWGLHGVLLCGCCKRGSYVTACVGFGVASAAPGIYISYTMAQQDGLWTRPQHPYHAAPAKLNSLSLFRSSEAAPVTKARSAEASAPAAAPPPASKKKPRGRAK